MQDRSAPGNAGVARPFDAPDASGAPAGMDAETLEFARQVFELVRSGEAPRLRGLLEKGLPPNMRNSRGDSMLMLASYLGHHDAARALLDHKADPAQRNDMGLAPLSGAAYKGDLEMVRLLLTHGADPEAVSPDGKSALMMAAMFDRVEVMELLLQHGARVDARDAWARRKRSLSWNRIRPDRGPIAT
jgi:ankyrin repeat protein